VAAFVVDASITLAWCFEDEASPWTDALLQRLKKGEEAIVPAHWPMEVANALVMAGRRGRVSDEKVDRFLQDLSSLSIRIDPESTSEAFRRSLALARQHKLTVYDAGYLEAAIRSHLPLATLDDDLRKAALAEGVLLPRTP
jgi:predicted nucleic acid-binding protein